MGEGRNHSGGSVSAQFIGKLGLSFGKSKNMLRIFAEILQWESPPMNETFFKKKNRRHLPSTFFTQPKFLNIWTLWNPTADLGNIWKTHFAVAVCPPFLFRIEFWRQRLPGSHNFPLNKTRSTNRWKGRHFSEDVMSFFPSSSSLGAFMCHFNMYFNREIQKKRCSWIHPHRNSTFFEVK